MRIGLSPVWKVKLQRLEPRGECDRQPVELSFRTAVLAQGREDQLRTSAVIAVAAHRDLCRLLRLFPDPGGHDHADDRHVAFAIGRPERNGMDRHSHGGIAAARLLQRRRILGLSVGKEHHRPWYHASETAGQFPQGTDQLRVQVGRALRLRLGGRLSGVAAAATASPTSKTSGRSIAESPSPKRYTLGSGRRFGGICRPLSRTIARASSQRVLLPPKDMLREAVEEVDHPGPLDRPG